MKIFWTENAVKNLEDIRDYIAKFDSDAAKRIIIGIHNSIQRLEKAPFSGRLYPYKNDENLREIIFKKKYRIVYKLTPRGIEIFLIAHCSRLMNIE